MTRFSLIILFLLFVHINCGKQLHDDEPLVPDWSNLPDSFFYQFGSELNSYLFPNKIKKLSTFGFSPEDPIIWATYSIFRDGFWTNEDTASFVDCGTGLGWNRIDAADTLRFIIRNPLSEILAESYLHNNYKEQLGRYYFKRAHQFDFFASALFGSGFKKVFDSIFGDSVTVRLYILTKPENPIRHNNNLYSAEYKFYSNEIYNQWVTNEHQRLSLNNKFVLSVAENNIDSAKFFRKMGIDVNAQTDSTNLFYLRHPVSALHLAKSTEAIKLLLSEGADINKIDYRGNTALHIAVNRNKFELAEVLVRNGADLEAKTKSGRTPIHLAIRIGNWEMVNLLIENGCNVNALDNDESTALHYCELYLCKNIEAKKTYLKIARFLLAAGVDLEAKDATHRTALHWAILRSERRCDNAQLIKL